MATVLPVLSSSCGNDVLPAPLLRINPSANGTVALTVPMYPDLVALGGALTLDLGLAEDTPYAAARGGVLLVHRADPPDANAFVAFQSSCNHLGCPLGFSLKSGLIECPCHGSRFVAVADPAVSGSCAGRPTHLPAINNLIQWEVTYNSTTQVVSINLGKTLSCGSGGGLPAVANGKVTFVISDFPELTTIGGSVLGQPSGLADRLIITRLDQATVIVNSATCTHLQCDVEFRNAGYSCDCHGSRFDTNGTVLVGPAPTALKKYVTTFDGTTVTITV